jgi:hypothetical protein
MADDYTLADIVRLIDGLAESKRASRASRTGSNALRLGSTGSTTSSTGTKSAFEALETRP